MGSMPTAPPPRGRSAQMTAEDAEHRDGLGIHPAVGNLGQDHGEQQRGEDGEQQRCVTGMRDGHRLGGREQGQANATTPTAENSTMATVDLGPRRTADLRALIRPGPASRAPARPDPP